VTKILLAPKDEAYDPDQKNLSAEEGTDHQWHRQCH
jgi:hypothetical protein